jgi:hypothetical protein
MGYFKALPGVLLVSVLKILRISYISKPGLLMTALSL